MRDAIPKPATPAVRVPEHVLRSLDAADLSHELALLRYQGRHEEALELAAADGKRFDAEHAIRCPICQRFMPCLKHPENANG